jgi:hypothetical protein
MSGEKHVSLLYFAFVILFMQLIVSIILFSQSSPDGGYWTFVLGIFGAVNIVYAIFVSWLVRSCRTVVVHASLSTLALSGCLFLLNNFGRLFGQEGYAMFVKLGLGNVLGSDITPYFLYALFAIIPLLTKFGEVRGSHGQ